MSFLDEMQKKLTELVFGPPEKVKITFDNCTIDRTYAPHIFVPTKRMKMSETQYGDGSVEVVWTDGRREKIEANDVRRVIGKRVESGFGVYDFDDGSRVRISIAEDPNLELGSAISKKETFQSLTAILEAAGKMVRERIDASAAKVFGGGGYTIKDYAASYDAGDAFSMEIPGDGRPLPIPPTWTMPPVKVVEKKIIVLMPDQFNDPAYRSFIAKGWPDAEIKNIADMQSEKPSIWNEMGEEAKASAEVDYDDGDWIDGAAIRLDQAMKAYFVTINGLPTALSQANDSVMINQLAQKYAVGATDLRNAIIMANQGVARMPPNTMSTSSQKYTGAVRSQGRVSQASLDAMKAAFAAQMTTLAPLRGKSPIEELHEKMEQARAAGLLTPNEAREELGLVADQDEDTFTFEGIKYGKPK